MGNVCSVDGIGPLSDKDVTVSIVVLNYNKKKELKRNLSQLQRLTYTAHEVIVVDNNSSDGSVDLVIKEFPEFSLIQSPINSGVSAGLNIGMRAARGKYIICLDDDAVAPIDICEKTEQIFNANPEVGCLAFLIKHMPQGYYNNEANVEALVSYHGAAHAFRGNAIRAINFMDEKMFFGAEEIDTALRLYEAGFWVRYTPEIVVMHFPRRYSGPERMARRSYWIAEWGWFYMKHFPLNQAGPCILRVIVAHGLNAIRTNTIFEFLNGIVKFIRGIKNINISRKIASEKTRLFYLHPDCEPAHFNKPLIVKIRKKLLKR